MRYIILCLSGALALASQAAYAVAIWSAGAGDWFDASNWSSNVPTGGDDTVIANGGSATADSSSGFYPGGGTPAETGDLNIGVRSNPIVAPPFGTGSLDLVDVDLSVGGDLKVGVTDAPSSIGFGSSGGSLTTTGGLNDPGDVAVGGDAAIGLFVDGVASGTATGAVSVAGELTDMGAGSLQVGRTTGAGNADGTLAVGLVACPDNVENVASIARGIEDVYILRVEQFYPFPALSMVKELSRFKGADFVWCQEEPKNQGAWTFIEPNIEWVLRRIKAQKKRPKYAGRAASASPATGLASQHKAQQEALVNEALTIEGK